jgi:hypothetical protein
MNPVGSCLRAGYGPTGCGPARRVTDQSPLLRASDVARPGFPPLREPPKLSAFPAVTPSEFDGPAAPAARCAAPTAAVPTLVRRPCAEPGPLDPDNAIGLDISESFI